MSDSSLLDVLFDFTLELAGVALRIDSVSPSSIYAGQNTSLTLTGTLLDTVTEITIGGLPSTILSQSPTSLVCVTPDLEPNVFDILAFSNSDKASIRIFVLANDTTTSRYRITEKLLSYLYSAFSGAPSKTAAFTLTHSNEAFAWSVAGYMFRGELDGEFLFEYNLEHNSILELTWLLGNIPNLAVTGLSGELKNLSACVILEGSGSSGPVPAYTAILWQMMETIGYELVTAGLSISDMLAQMSMQTAGAQWLDYWGATHFGIPRVTGEADAAYAKRVLVEVLRPRGNNKAMELAILEQYGQSASIEDVYRLVSPTNSHDGSFDRDGSRTHSAPDVQTQYGLFKAVIGFDLLGADNPSDFAASLRTFIDRFRDAGTHLTTLELASSGIDDTYSAVTSETHAATLRTEHRHDGQLLRNGSKTRIGYTDTVDAWS